MTDLCCFTLAEPRGNRTTVTGASGAGGYTVNNLNQYTTAGGVGSFTYAMITGGGAISPADTGCVEQVETALRRTFDDSLKEVQTAASCEAGVPWSVVYQWRRKVDISGSL